MKTTVEIADGLFKRAKAVAQQRGVPMRELIEDGLRKVVEQDGKPKGTFAFEDCSYPGHGNIAGPGMRKNFTWPEIRALIYEGRGSRP